MKEPIKLSDITGIKPDTRTHSPTRAVVLPRCSVGIEVELENVRNIGHQTPNLDLWRLESDGSLRNGGMEFISHVIRGADVITALDQLQDVLKEHNPDYSASSRTSVHIHLDVRNYNLEQLLRLCVVYSIFERALFEYVGTDRADSNFCVPYYQADNVVSLISYLTTRDEHRINMGLATPKYTALNLAPSRTQGSVEFRHHRGTASKKELLQWINIIMSLKRFTSNWKGSSQDIIDSVCSSGINLFNEVFRDTLPKYNRERMADDMLSGARVAQEILYRFKRENNSEKIKRREVNKSNSLFHKLYGDSIKTTKSGKKLTGYSIDPEVVASLGGNIPSNTLSETAIRFAELGRAQASLDGQARPRVRRTEQEAPTEWIVTNDTTDDN